MKIAVVRGPSLNLWEMQNYFPLAKKHELLLIGSTKGHYGWSSEILTKKLLCPGEICSFIPGGITFLYQRFGDPQILFGLEKAIKNFDIIHTAETSNYYSYQALKARRKGLCGKLVVTCWENIPGLHEDHLAQKRIKSEVIGGADHFLAVTNQVKEALLTDGAPEEKITVIPMGVDLDKFRIKNKKNFEILFVGRLVEEKGVWELLKAFRMVAEQLAGFDLRLRMVGSGPLRGDLIKRAQEWGIREKLTIEDKIYSEMPKVYQEVDLFVLPSIFKKDWQEQFGMVLVEAMACGVPVIATRSGATAEVMDEAGVLVTPGNASELSETIMKFLKDEKLRNDLSVKGRRRAEAEYDCQKVALKIEKLYREVIGG